MACSDGSLDAEFFYDVLRCKGAVPIEKKRISSIFHVRDSAVNR